MQKVSLIFLKSVKKTNHHARAQDGTKLFMLVLFLISMTFSACIQAKEQSLEYKIKAAYLFNFSKFTVWPDESRFSEQNSFMICILGKDPFGAVIAPIENKTINGQPIKLLYLDATDSDLNQCRVLFISEEKQNELRSILHALSNSTILTVGESSDFVNSGGMIGFVIHDGRVLLQINENAAYAAKLKFDPRLLKLGKSINYYKK